jgi:DNA repair exonuclease SbcCD nuclease subunit
VRILHLADVHLDRPFVGLPADAARRRRAGLWDAFVRCLELGRDRGADLITIGGDLWEHEHVQKNTINSVAYELERVGVPTLVVCGNHDPFVPGSGYALADWPDNVDVVRSGELEPREFGDVVLWAASWTGSPPAVALDEFRVPDDDRTHILFVHGTSGPLAYLAEDVAWSFQAEQVRKAGFARCLSGHIHIASDDGTIVYSGSPEPLRWNETERHCVALAETANDSVEVELVDVNRFRVVEQEVVCSGCRSSAELERRVADCLDRSDAAQTYLRIFLTGEVGADCTISRQRLIAASSGYAGLAVEDRTEPLLDVDGRADRPGLDGLLVRKLRERMAAAHDDEQRVLQLALEAGLRAIDGRDEILHVD